MLRKLRLEFPGAMYPAMSRGVQGNTRTDFWGITLRVAPLLQLSLFWVSVQAIPDCKEIDVIPAGLRTLGNDNSAESVRRELLDTSLVLQILQSSGLPDSDAATITVIDKPGTGAVLLCHSGGSDIAFRLLQHRLWWYTAERSEGHTANYFLAALTNSAHPPIIKDRALRAIIEGYPTMPAALLKKWRTGSYTNMAGQEVGKSWTGVISNGQPEIVERPTVLKTDEIVYWVDYVLRDGKLAWLYRVHMDPSSPIAVSSSVRDVMEFDPAYSAMFARVEANVAAEIKNAGTDRGAGSGRIFCDLMKERLRSLGIDWQPPKQLTPIQFSNP